MLAVSHAGGPLSGEPGRVAPDGRRGVGRPSDDDIGANPPEFPHRRSHPAIEKGTISLIASYLSAAGEAAHDRPLAPRDPEQGVNRLGRFQGPEIVGSTRGRRAPGPPGGSVLGEGMRNQRCPPALSLRRHRLPARSGANLPPAIPLRI